MIFDPERIKHCPMCKVPIEKDEGCAQMMCKRCKHVFCWYCLASLDVSNFFYKFQWLQLFKNIGRKQKLNIFLLHFYNLLKMLSKSQKNWFGEIRKKYHWIISVNDWSLTLFHQYKSFLFRLLIALYYNSALNLICINFLSAGWLPAAPLW